MSETKETMGFEEKLQQIQTIIDGIESGKLPLEDSVAQYERGMKILSGLEEELKDMNRRISILRDGKETETGNADV